MADAHQPARILVVDNHDSFVHTIVGYLRHLGAAVDLVRHECPDIVSRVAEYDGVLVSPGPGTPHRAGRSLEVVAACARRALPLLGVCLGHQALAVHYGGQVRHAPRIVHGSTSPIHHDGTGLFAGLPSPTPFTRYHSWVVEADSLPGELAVTAVTDDGIVMALAHRTLPLTGVQFHPEAVRSPDGYRLLANWLSTTGQPSSPSTGGVGVPVVAGPVDTTSVMVSPSVT